MKIMNEQTLSSVDGTLVQPNDRQIKEIVDLKSLSDLAAGDRFKADIVDIQPNMVTLRLRSGNTLTAKSLILPEVRIGDESVFIVKENIKGQIMLEMEKRGEQVIKNNIAREALRGAGLYQTEENMRLAAHMMDKHMPMDAKNLQKAALFHFIKPETAIEKTLFLLKENFPVAENHVTVLDHLMGKTHGLAGSIERAVEAVFKLSDELLKAELIEAALKTGANGRMHMLEKPPVQKEILRELTLDFKTLVNPKAQQQDKNGFKVFKRYYNHLLETVNRLDEKLAGATQTQPETTDLREKLAEVREQLFFMDHIRQYKNYMQIPFNLDGQLKQGELFVFKNGRGGVRESGKSSVLITLENVYIGRVEAFVTMCGKILSMQFRTENEHIVHVMDRNKDRLLTALSEKGYAVSGLDLKAMTQPFAITDDLGADDKEEHVQKRYAFDMRV